jgi:hypothetical protein
MSLFRKGAETAGHVSVQAGVRAAASKIPPIRLREAPKTLSIAPGNWARDPEPDPGTSDCG